MSSPWQEAHPTATLSDLADYLECECHPRTRAALGSARRRLVHGNLVVELEALLEGRMRELSDVVLPRIRALELARLAAGPWPDPSFGSLRPRATALEAQGSEILGLVERLRASEAIRGTQAIERLERAILHELDVEGALVGGGAELETERRLEERVH